MLGELTFSWKIVFNVSLRYAESAKLITYKKTIFQGFFMFVPKIMKKFMMSVAKSFYIS